MTHDLEGDLRDELSDWEWPTATTCAPDDLVATILAVFAPLEAKAEKLAADKEALKGLHADAVRISDEMRRLRDRAEDERDEARAALQRVRTRAEDYTRSANTSYAKAGRMLLADLDGSGS